MDRASATTGPTRLGLGREGSAAASLSDEAVRRAWDDEIRQIGSRQQSGDTVVASEVIVEALRHFDLMATRELRALLATALRPTEPEQRTAEWIRSRYRELSQAAADSFRLRVGIPGPDMPREAGRLAAFGLAGFGAAVKWAEMAESHRDPTLLVEAKRLYALAASTGLAGERHAVAHGGAEATRSLTALFVHVLMLDALCRGNLGQRQVEIIDSWLEEWSGDYALTDHAEGAVLAFDAQGGGGLRAAGVAEASAATRRFLNIDALSGHIAMVVGGFRHGEIFPGHGCASSFRVEEHVAALEHLRQFLDGAQRREARALRAGRTDQLAVVTGLAEIMSTAYTEQRAAVMQEDPADPGTARTAVDSRLDIPHRLVHLLDESSSGLGIACEDPSIAADVGELVAVLAEEGSAPVVCEVVRRAPPDGTGRASLRLGLRVLSRSARRLRLQRVDSGQALEAVYLPGGDRSGCGDGFIASQADLEAGGLWEAVVRDRAFLLRFGHVRRQGPGWRLVGFEVVEAKARDRAQGSDGRYKSIASSR